MSIKPVLVILTFLLALAPRAAAVSGCGRLLESDESRLIILIDLAECRQNRAALRIIAEKIFPKPAYSKANEAAEEFILATQSLVAPELLSTFLIHNVKRGTFRPSDEVMKLALRVAQSDGMEDSLLTLIEIFPPQSTDDLLKFFTPVE